MISYRSLLLVATVVLFVTIATNGSAQDIDDLFGTPDEVAQDQELADEGDTNAAGDTGPDGGDPNDGGTGDNATDTVDSNGSPTENDDFATEKSEDTLAPPPIDIAALTTAPTRVSGSVSATGGASIGVNEWPWTDVAEGRTALDLAEYSVGYTMSSTVSVDSRPAPYLRFYTALSTSLNTASLGFSTPAIGDFFVDYTLNDTLFFKVGKYSMGWGRARLFTSPANLVSRVGEGAAVRVTVPAGPGSVTGVIYTRPAWTATYGEGQWESFAFAGQWERTIGSVSFELASHWQKDEAWQNAAALTLGIRELTLAGEVGYDMDQDAPGAPGTDGNTIGYIGNFFWETATRSWSFWGEYSYQGQQPRVGLALRAPSINRSGQWRPGLSWRHALNDDSGQILVGMEGTVAPSLTMSLGVPVFYGKPGTTYRDIAETRLNPDDDNLTDDEDDVLLISGDNVISFGFGFSLSFSF